MSGIKLFVAATALLMVAASCGKDDPDNSAVHSVIEFTCTPVDNVVTFNAFVQSITVDWGDGSTEEYKDLVRGNAEVSHTYANNTERIVRVLQAVDMSLFYCEKQQLTALDVSNCLTLTVLVCSNNQLSANALDDILTGLPDRSGMEAGKV
jgi:hypothetical protein